MLVKNFLKNIYKKEILGYKVNFILINIDKVLQKFQHLLKSLKGPKNSVFQREINTVLRKIF